MSRHKIVGTGIVVVVLFVFGVAQMQAQSSLTLEGLSSRITTLTRRVSTLSNNKADKSELSELEGRIATLEARLETARPHPTPTPTRPRPTSAPTRARPTETPTPATPSAITTRNMNVRRGPSTDFAVVYVAGPGEEFRVTGKNADGTWWRISHEAQNVWIYAPFVTATNTDSVRVVPTPALPHTPTQRPSPTSSAQHTAEEYAYALIIRDQGAIGNSEENWRASSQGFKDAAIAMTAALLIATADYCDEPVDYTALLVDEFGAHLDKVGYTTRRDIRARPFLMLSMMGVAEKFQPQLIPCRGILELTVTNLLAEE